MIIRSREYVAQTAAHWIAYGPGIARGRLDPGATIRTGKEVLEVFADASAFAARLAEIEADLEAALLAARALPSAPLDILAHHRWTREGFDPVAAFDAAYETEARAQGIIS